MLAFRQLLRLSARALVFFVLVWGIFALIIIITSTNEYSKKSIRSNLDIRRVIDKFCSDKPMPEDLEQKLITDVDAYLEKRIKELLGDPLNESRRMPNENGKSIEMIPCAEYEQLRRRIRSNIDELYNYVCSEIPKNHSSTPDLLAYIDKVTQMTAEHKRSIINDMDHIQKVDGYEEWRQREAKDLSDLVQRRLEYLQNPSNCSTARKLVCNIDVNCGYGCQLHHVVYCLIMAYATERTLILDSKGWLYHENGREDIFQPLSKTCRTFEGQLVKWKNESSNAQTVYLPSQDSFNPRPPQYPLAIPEDIAPRLKRLHGNPITWWIGQLLKYLLRFQAKTQEFLDTSAVKLNFQTPIVGVHIRRTDKLFSEAILHEVEEYMKHVDEYYDQLEMIQNVEKRRVFLATDEPKTIDETRKRYPNYEIIVNPNAAQLASGWESTRYTDPSLYAIILDIHLLSRSDFIVCTLSSTVCRIAYELMQTMHPDASNRVKSLDVIYFYEGQNVHNVEVVLPHHRRSHDEILIQVGDLVSVLGNHWNGYSKGRNLRTNQVGLFPFKVVNKIETAEFPKYSNV